VRCGSGGLGYPALRGANQLLNAAGALAAFEALRERLPVSAQAIRTGLATVELPGRFQVVPGAPTIVLDVGHNPHAIAALALNLDQMGFFPRTHAVFGVMRDKDVAAIVAKLAPLVDAWHLTDLPTPRAASAAELAAAVRGVAAAAHATVAVHARPADALAAAMAEADPADRIVVFGSFFTVGGVLENARSAPVAAPPEPTPAPLLDPLRTRPSMFRQKRDPASDKPTIEPADAVQQARTRAAAAADRRDRAARDRHHRLSARLRDAAAADPGRHPDRDPAPRCAAAARDAAAAIDHGTAGGAGERIGRSGVSLRDGRGRLRFAATRASSPSRAADAGREVASPRATARASAPAETPRRAASATVAAASTPAATRAADGERARALLEGRAASAAEEARYVVQVGAFADAEAARETRKNVEKLGLKTYTQVAQTSGGSRIRVRVGPFTSRGDAEAALAKAKAAGMNAVLLTL
jgi:cell division protein FtsN